MTPSLKCCSPRIIYIFLDALYKGDLCGMKRLVKTLAHSHKNTNAINLPLFKAIEKFSTGLIRRLIESGASVINSYNEFTPLTRAVLQGDTNIVNLFEYLCDNARGTPLFYALFDGDIPLAILLLEKGANPNIACCKDFTPLVNVVLEDYTGIATAHFLFEYGLDGANVIACNKVTPLGWAVLQGNARIVNLLLAYGADPSLCDHFLGTPLFYALSRCDIPLALLLLENGANPNKPVGDRATMMTHVVQYTEGGTAQGYVLHVSGSDSNIPDDSGDTPLILAVKRNRADLVNLLARHNATQVDLPNAETGETPLFIASKIQRYEIVRSLIEHGADVNVVAPSGCTPLHVAIASQRCYRKTTEWLNTREAFDDFRIVAEKPLWSATELDDFLTVQVLLEHHADTEMRDALGRTALCWASLRGSLAVTYLLVRRDPPSALRNLLQVATSCSSQIINTAS